MMTVLLPRRWLRECHESQASSSWSTLPDASIGNRTFRLPRSHIAAPERSRPASTQVGLFCRS